MRAARYTEPPSSRTVLRRGRSIAGRAARGLALAGRKQFADFIDMAYGVLRSSGGAVPLHLYRAVRDGAGVEAFLQGGASRPTINNKEKE